MFFALRRVIEELLLSKNREHIAAIVFLVDPLKIQSLHWESDVRFFFMTIFALCPKAE